MESTLAALRDSVDLVLAFDLVEHLYDLPRFLREVRSALRPGGRLALLTGDIESGTARRVRQGWWYVRYPEHIVFPSWSYWQRCDGFTDARRVRTYASRGYRAGALRRAVGLARLAAGGGNGLPLVGPDHHLVVLTRT
jgi:SAM-dependent methyltransferase